MNAAPERVEHQMTDKGYVPIYTTAVVEQPWADYTETDHQVWATLFERQRELLVGRASEEFMRSKRAMGMTADRIPKFDDLNRMLRAATGWELIGVQGLLPELDFFDHLANRRFPAGNFIRTPDQLDYLQEPDVFHDVFGHVPMLADPVFADYMVAYGKGGLRSLGFGALHKLARLYWYTVEFGLIEEPAGLRIYGAGIVSSYGESLFCLDDPSPNRIRFDLLRLMRTEYRIDDFQQNYFVIPSLEHLLMVTVETDFAPLYAQLEALPDIPIADILADDDVITRGTQAYAQAKSAA